MLPDIISAMVQEGIGILTGAVPGQSIAGAATGSVLRRVLEQRLQAAARILREGMASGRLDQFDAAAQNEFAAILFGYLRCAQEGAARRNLRLLAQVISRQLATGALLADEFLYYADILGTLKRHEIVVIGTMIRLDKAMRSEGLHLHEGEVLAHHLWNRIDAELLAAGGVFRSRNELRGIAYGLLRTGLLRLPETVDEDVQPKPSPLLSQVAAFCDFEAADREEDPWGKGNGIA